MNCYCKQVLILIDRIASDWDFENGDGYEVCKKMLFKSFTLLSFICILVFVLEFISGGIIEIKACNSGLLIRNYFL